MANVKPKWMNQYPYAIPTKYGWVNGETGEQLTAQRGLEDQVDIPTRPNAKIPEQYWRSQSSTTPPPQAQQRSAAPPPPEQTQRKAAPKKAKAKK